MSEFGPTKAHPRILNNIHLLTRHLAIRAQCMVILCVLGSATPAAVATTAEDLLDLSALKGRVVYLDFWASWCVPCRHSFPWMARMQGEFGANGFVVIAVNVDRARADAERFLQEHPAHFRVVYDPDGVLAEKFGVQGMPTSFLIERSGRIAAKHEGFRLKERDALAQEIRSLVVAR